MLSLTLAACVPPPPNTPAPRPAAPVSTQPRPSLPAPPAPADWRDAPQTPGSWSYSASERGSTASFGSGVFAIQCDTAARSLILIRAAAPRNGATAMTITTSTGSKALPATGSGRGVIAALPARDATLDAMAFSRGRFAVTVPGEMPLYVPSWTEISRVIEDCR